MSKDLLDIFGSIARFKGNACEIPGGWGYNFTAFFCDGSSASYRQPPGVVLKTKQEAIEHMKQSLKDTIAPIMSQYGASAMDLKEVQLGEGSEKLQ